MTLLKVLGLIVPLVLLANSILANAGNTLPNAALLPGTRIIAGDLTRDEFFIVSDRNASQIKKAHLPKGKQIANKTPATKVTQEIRIADKSNETTSITNQKNVVKLKEALKHTDRHLAKSNLKNPKLAKKKDIITFKIAVFKRLKVHKNRKQLASSFQTKKLQHKLAQIKHRRTIKVAMKHNSKVM